MTSNQILKWTNGQETTNKNMKIVIIKIEDLKDEKVESCPYLILKTSHVGDQDIWQGQPEFLLGFSKKPKAGKIDLLFRNFWRKPKKAKGMYPVFRSSNEKWYTKKAKVIKVTVLNRIIK